MSDKIVKIEGSENFPVRTGSGRHTNCNEEVIDNMVAALSLNVSRKAAGYIANIAERTLYLWLEKGREQEKLDESKRDPDKVIYMQFMQAVQWAEGQVERGLIDEILAEQGGARWLAARRFRDMYGNHFEVKTVDGGEDKRQIALWPDQMKDDE